MTALVLRAEVFAAEAHKGQVRKYTGEPYVTHCLEVAQILRDSGAATGSEMLAAAILHDVVEDCGVTLPALGAEFGAEVANLVAWLTDWSFQCTFKGNRAERKAFDRNYLSWAPAEAQTIKLADLISNTRSIVQYDTKFAETYLAEKRFLLEVLTKGDTNLHRIATELANQ